VGKIDWDQYPDAPAGSDKWDQYPDADQYTMPDAIAALPTKALGAIQSGLSKIDSYTGAPARAAIGSLQNDVTDPSAAISAARAQFGQDPSLAPTGQVIVEKAGVPKDSAAAKVLGFGMDMASNPASYIPIGDAVQAGVKAAGGVLGSGVEAVTGPVANALKSFAAEKAVTATGATGVQAAKFAPEAAQELLDQGIVKFGDSQSKIAQKATDALAQSGKKIGDVLADLDKRGATVDQADIVSSLRKRASDLGKDPSQFGVSDSLNKLADRIEATIGDGNSSVPLGQAEATKRGFQAAANYNSAPLDLSVSKEAAGIYRQAVEDAATKFDPKAAEAFAAEKKSYQLMSPVQEAAAKRASTLAQSPHGGLMDTVATIAGEGAAGVPGAIVAPIARRAVATRLASSEAAAANAAGNFLSKAPAAATSAANAAAPAAPTAIRAAIASAPLAPSALRVAGQPGQPNRSPAKGPDAWAQSGLQKLGIQDTGLTQRLLSDPKAKQLLIQASDMAPGSKAMSKIMSQIQSGWGAK
jgi:hypothetical protein